MAEEAKIKLVLEGAEARKELDRFREELRRTGDAAGKAAQGASGAMGSFGGQVAGTLGRSALGGISQALSRPGGGLVDFATQALEIFKRELPALGAKLGPAGLVAGVGAAAGLERQFGPQVRAREAGIAGAAAITERFAQVGAPVSDATMKSLVSQLSALAAASEANTARARSAAGGTEVLKQMIASAATFGR